MANEPVFSLKEIIRNRKTKKRLFGVFFIFVYILSLFIYQDYWTKLIDFLWVDPIACKFDSSNIYWLILYGLVLSIILLYYIVSFANERRYSIFRISLLLFVLSLFLFCSESHDWTFDGCFGLIIILELTLSELCVLCNIFQKHGNDTDEYNGLAFEHPIVRSKQEILSSKEPYGRTDYVISTYSLLKNTFDSKAAFAIGISGKWGSGKTSFSNDLKTLLKDDTDLVMEFKPWFCKSPNEVIEDFFNEYRYNISSFIPGLNSKLKFYMDTLQNVEFHNSTMRVSLKNFIPQKSSERIYGEIMDALKKAAVKVVIIIDDLDRLDKDEILEVLRLIRNTANFPYTQFIVTYDKDYVLKTLPHNVKVNYNDFLMKIFNLEIELPTFEKIVICNSLTVKLLEICSEKAEKFSHATLRKDIFARINKVVIQKEIDDNNGDVIVDSIKDEDSGVLVIPRILDSMRDVIRFSNAFNLNISSFGEAINDIDLCDFFHLELIRYHFTSLYYSLRDNPTVLLYLNDKSNNYQIDNPFGSNLEPRPSKFQENVADYVLVPTDREIVFYLLEKMFDSKRHDSKSISTVSNYFTYFANRLDAKNISISEFISVLQTEKENACRELATWYDTDAKNKGQIEDKLIVCLKMTIPNEMMHAELDYNRLYDLITYALENSNTTDLNFEIYNSILQHFSRDNNVIANINKMSIEQYKSFVKFWLYNFDYIQGKESDINFYLLKYIFEGGKGLSKDIVAILSTEIKSKELQKSIYEFLETYRDFINSRTVPDTNDVDVIIDIQCKRFDNYLNTTGIDRLALDMYLYAQDSIRLFSKHDKHDEIYHVLIKKIEEDPFAFFENNILITPVDIKISIPFNDFYTDKTFISNLDRMILSRKLNFKPKIKRYRNLWKLLKNNEYDVYNLSLDGVSLQSSVENDFEKERKSLDSLLKIEVSVAELSNSIKQINADSTLELTKLISGFNITLGVLKHRLVNINLYISKRTEVDHMIDDIERLIVAIGSNPK